VSDLPAREGTWVYYETSDEMLAVARDFLDQLETSLRGQHEADLCPEPDEAQRQLSRFGATRCRRGPAKALHGAGRRAERPGAATRPGPNLSVILFARAD
jgi:hypothetical protein